MAHQTYPHHNYQWFPLFFIIGTPNTCNTIAKAIGRKDYPFAVLFMLVFVGFFRLQFHLSKYKDEKWSQNLSPNLNMWFLHALPFGLIYQLADIFSPQFTFTMYTVVLLSSWIMFYMFIIDDLVKCWEVWRHGEDEHQLPEIQSLDAVKFDYNCVSISEKLLFAET